ncbi:hypothetical protein [Allorhizocola rhizosphaerae]|uniref:hypothetical protein n=1 Tax=Allorhizocola rhizosphaerae TaxID=1872709 RepID=UPI000E3BACE3|nr:hypothetical protein [Allorhizocola rhizosphaerae]
MTLINEIVTTTVVVDGVSYPAEPVAGGAAYEVFSEVPAPGFLRMLAPGRWPYHRFVPSEETGVETVLRAPVRRGMSWESIHRLSQSPPRDAASAELVAGVRATATVRRGTRMVKPLTARGVTAVLKGHLPHGFCYREWDVAHLRTPLEQSILTGDAAGEAAYLLRWRAIDPSDYHVPTGPAIAGLVAMPPHDRVGAPVLGTGFTPSAAELIPEWITADFANLPLPANAALVAYAADGTEIVLYAFQPEQRGWVRMVGPQWRHLAPDDREYVPIPPGEQSSRLVGMFRGEEYDAVADPPDEFRVLAMNRAARYPVESLLRRTRYARWRGALATVLTQESSWTRLRLCRPDPANVAALGAQCYERGVYEVWAPTNEVDTHTANLNYSV